MEFKKQLWLKNNLFKFAPDKRFIVKKVIEGSSDEVFERFLAVARFKNPTSLFELKTINRYHSNETGFPIFLSFALHIKGEDAMITWKELMSFLDDDECIKKIGNYKKVIDLRCNEKYSALLNTANNDFLFENVRVSSMESLLQGIKFKNERNRLNVCWIKGAEVKEFSKRNFWFKHFNKVFWKNGEMDRFGDDYRDFVSRAFDAMAIQNPRFVLTLLETEDAELHYTEGIDDQRKTTLTRSEYLYQLNRLRDVFREGLFTNFKTDFLDDDDLDTEDICT